MNKEYGITELARMFKTTRATIYRKLDTDSIQQYVIQSQKGKKLLQEGLTQFQLIMAESKVTNIQKKDEKKDLTDDYINNLKNQIDSLSKDKENLYKEIVEKNSQLKTAYNIINNSQKLLTESNEKIKLLEEKKLKDKKTIWDIFKKPKE
jgi:DeoR/GlpR family transcriptional regulator of sugar metabolism